jgi:leucyl aminopeptidase
MSSIQAASSTVGSALKTSDLTVCISQSINCASLTSVYDTLIEQSKHDPRIGVSPSLIAAANLPGGRCLHVPCPNLKGDFKDVRCFFTLGKQIAQLLSDLDSHSPAIILDSDCLDSNAIDNTAQTFEHALGMVYLGICQALWQPLEANEFLGEEKLNTVKHVLLIDAEPDYCNLLNAIESGKVVARDLCGTEPERMAPPKFAEYCEKAFANTSIKCEVEDDSNKIAKDYPLLFAVARASIEVERHRPRVIHLEYMPEGEVTKTIYLAGKGITYDTGGADLKVNGHMAGMSRDKGGAAAVAGLMLSIDRLKPKGVRVVAQIGAVRNSIGAEAYVPDEIIMSHAGVRVRVGNTDAEGRMVLSDLLSHMRVQALKEPSPSDALYSVATLTGHAAIAFGPYTALVENGPALKTKATKNIIAAGEAWGDPCEQSRLRIEDFEFIQSKTKADDVLSSNNKPSVSTVRGHQFPAAFLIVSAGLDQHDSTSEKPLSFTHIDIAGSGVENLDWQHGKPTAAPIAALLNGLILND